MASATGLPPPASASASSSPSVPPAGTLAAPLPSATDSSTGIGGSSSSSSGAAFTSSFSPTSIASATDRWGPISQAASTSALSPHQQHLILQPLQQQQQQQWDHSDQHHSGHLTPAASNIRLPTSSPGSHPTLSSAALGGNRLSQTEDAAPSFIRTAQGSSVTYLPSSSGLPPQAGGVGVIGSSAAQLSSPHSRSSGPRHQLSSPTLGVGSPHNSLSAILAGGGPHDDDEHDWEKDIHRQHALGIGHEEDDTDHPRRLPARSSSQRRSHNAASTHTHTHSAASFADWSPPASSPVLHGSRSIHFPPTAGHSRSGSATASAQPQIVSSAHPLHHLHHHHQQQAPPSSLHRLIAPFRDQQQASLSQLLLGTNSAGARSPGSVSSTSTTEYFMSAANQNPVNSDISLFDKSDSDQSRMVRRHQSLNHHIGRGLASRTNPSQLGSPSAVGSSSTVGRNAAAATLRANADPRLGPSNPYTASNRSPPPSQTGPGNESLRSPTSPSRFAGSIFRDRTTVEREREAGNSGSPTPSHFSGAGDGASSPTPGRTRGLSDAPNSLMTLHAHLQQLDIHGASPSLNSRPVPAPLNPSARPPLETEQSVDSLSTVTARTPTGLMHAPHLAQGSSAATGHDATSTSTAHDSRQSASEGTDSVNAALAQGPQSEAAAEGSGTNKPRKLPSLITNRDALVRGAMGGGPGAASAAPAGFGFTGSLHFEQAGPSGPATAGAVLHPSDPVEPGHTADSALAGIDSPTAFSPIRGDERDDLEELYEGTRSSSLRQNTFDGAIRPSPSSSSIGQKTGSRFNLLRGTKTAAPVAGWRQKDLIAGGRNEPQAGTDEYAGDDYREGPSAHAGTHTTSLGRASSLHHTHGSGSRYKEYASVAPGMPSVPGDGFGNADVQSQWGIALSPQAGANQAPDLFESLLGGGRPARSGSMRVRGSRNQYDEFPRGGIQEASSEVMSSPYASAGAALDASPYQTSSGLGGAASPTSTALEQANIDTMRLSMALAEQQQKTAFLRAQMSMANNGAGMGGGAVPSVPGLGLPYNPSAGMGLGMGIGLGPAQGPGFIPDALNFGGIGGAQVRPPSLSDGFPQDLGARAAQQFGFGGDANSGLGRGQTQNDISGPPLYDPNLMNGPNGSLSTGIGGLPPLTIPSDTTGGPATGTVPSAVTPSSAVQMAQLIAAKGYNPPTFPMRPVNARYFVIKSFTEDDVYKCLKYEIWASTDKGNQRLDRAFRENSRAPGEGGTDGKGTGPGPIYLFFSVNASGHFCGMAQMLTPVDYNTSSNVWAQDGKWKGTFKVRWIFVKDLPNGQLRHIRLTNTPEVKSVTQSRDTQELPREAGEEVLRIMAEYQARTSLLQDMSFYEMQDQRILPLPAHAGAGGAGGSGMAPSAGPIGSQTPQAPDNPRRRHFVSPPYNNANIGAGPGGHGFHNNQRSFQQDQPASAS